MLTHGLQDKVAKLVADNAAGILTGVGVVGTAVTAYLAGRASYKAAQIIDDSARSMAENNDADLDVVRRAMSTSDRVKLVWPHYLPAIGAGALTVTSIVMSNRISAKRAAALAAAYTISQNQFEEYRKKVLEKVGLRKEEAIVDAIAQDKVDANPPSGSVLLLGDGKVLCFDSLSGRYFQSSADQIKKAENAVNHQLFHHQICSLSFLYDELGIETTALSDGLGWNMTTADDSQLQIKISAVLVEETRPCLSMSFNNLPVHNYEQLY